MIARASREVSRTIITSTSTTATTQPFCTLPRPPPRVEPDAEKVFLLHLLHKHEQQFPIASRKLIVGTPDMQQRWWPSNDKALAAVECIREACTETVGGGGDDMAPTLSKAMDAVRSMLETADAHDDGLLRFPDTIMFHGTLSPGRTLLTKMMEQLFSKAGKAKQTTQQHHQHSHSNNNNNSSSNSSNSSNSANGFGIAAPFGMGKSTLLRLVTCISSVLFPTTSAWPCYIDLSNDRVQGLEMVDLLEFVRQHYLNETLSRLRTGTKPMAAARQQKVAVVLLLDELERAYTWDNEFWSSVAEFTGNTGTICFAASSSSRFPAIAAGHNHERIADVYGDAFPLRQPLHGDNLLDMLPLPPMSTHQQYKQFVGNRLPSMYDQPRAQQRDLIKRMHWITGGNLRMLGKQLARLRRGRTLDKGPVYQEEETEDEPSLAALLQALSHQDTRGDLTSPTVPLDEAIGIIRRAQPGARAYAVLDRFTHTRNGLLYEVLEEAGDRSVVLARHPGRLSLLRQASRQARARHNRR